LGSSHKEKNANPAAASSSDGSDNEPQSAQLPPQPPLSAKTFLGRSHALRGTGCGEWVKAAELVRAMVPGSVEDERLSSALEYVRNPPRKRLHCT